MSASAEDESLLPEHFEEINQTSAGSPAQALDFSSRFRVLTGDNVGISGIIITGTQPKNVLLRGIGPSLANLGVPDPLADPILELYGSSGFTPIINDNWRDFAGPTPPPGLEPPSDLEPAITALLNPGAYTGVLRGSDNGVGVGLIEAYDLAQSTGRLGNISTRAFVGANADVMILGFILGGGTENDCIVARCIGPSLAQFGVPNPLANPQLELRNDKGTLLHSNNDWMDDPAPAALISAAGLAPANNFESAVYACLPPGQYTVVCSGVNQGTGIGLAEVYDLFANGVPTPTPSGTPSPSPSPSSSPSPSPATCVENWDSVTAPALPPGWVASNPIPGNGVMWATTTSMSESPPNNVFLPDEPGTSNKVLDRTGVNVTSASATLSFRNNYDLEFSDGTCRDYFVLEVSAPSISGGQFLNITDSQVGGSFVTGAYNCNVGGGTAGPITNQMAWGSSSNGYLDTVINLGPNLAGQTVTFRFRMVTDEAVGAPGVHIDNILFTGATCP